MAGLSKIGFKAGNLVAIDIGFSDIKFAEFSLEAGKKSWTLSKCAIIELLQTSEDKDRRAEIIKGLKNIFADKDNNTTDIVCVINDINGVEKKIITPSMSKSEMKEAIFWKMKDFIHFPVEEACIDFKVIGQTEIEGETKNEVFVAAIPKNTVDYYLALFREAKITPTSFVSLAVSLEHGLSAVEAKKVETIAFVDLGAEHCELVIFKDKKFVFSRQLPVSGSAMTRALSTVLDGASGRIALTFEEADNLKKECGIPSSSNEQIPGKSITCNQVLSLIRPEIEKLASEIEHSFDYYREEFGAARIDRLCLIGAGGQLKGLDVFLSKQLNMEVKRASFLSEADNIKQKIENPCAVFSCLGAARSLIEKNTSAKRDINLLPQEMKERNKLLIRKLLLEAATTFLVLAVFLSIFWVKLATVGVNKKLGAIKAQVYSLKYMQRESYLKGLIDQIYAREPRWADLFKEISNVIPENMYLQHLLYDKDELILQGVVVLSPDSDDKALSNFILALEKGIFKNVSLMESKNFKDSARLSRQEFKLRFQVE